MRELKDGRPLVVDSRDKLVQLVTLTANSAQHAWTVLPNGTLVPIPTYDKFSARVDDDDLQYLQRFQDRAVPASFMVFGF
ncbi:hypothetical protein [Gemmatimonas sp.]|uniref:hypothetical protein n=1 Tax=Gemmatimonas sp. TaxID=1962908 RepID=UPI00356472D0